MASYSLPLPELSLLSPQFTPKHRLTLSRFCPCKSLPRSSSYKFILRARIRAIKEEGAVIGETKSELVERVNDIEWSGNGAAGTSGGNHGKNGSVNGYVNGSSGVIESENGVSNGSLVTYVNGNGAAAEVVDDAETSEDGRKKRIEEIGKEDAWFKQTGNEPVEVCVH